MSIPIVTPEEMRAIDAAAPEPVEVLVDRAGAAVARHALDILGGAYGRRVVVVAGKGNNGADGRIAAARLERRGVRVQVVDAAAAPAVLPAADLVIDAAYGTGFRGRYDAPDTGAAFVLAVDIPSGVDGVTGHACDGAVDADATVTFAALKPGHLLGDGRERSGAVTVVDIGLDATGANASLVEPEDVCLPRRSRDAHKYAAAVAVVAGSPGMTGAPALAARAAFRSGSGYVRLAVPGGGAHDLGVTEAVAVALPARSWASEALALTDRMKAVAVGPGLGRLDDTLRSAERFITEAALPAVVDGDGLRAVTAGMAFRGARVLTPHDGEFAHLTGRAPGDDRLAATRAAAAAFHATVVLKGPTTIVADAGGDARFVTTGPTGLATAGTGDVLTGVIASFLAQGLGPLDAASFAACVHGLSARAAGGGDGLVASDVVDALPAVLWPGR